MRPIQVGDLVQVVRGCQHCGDLDGLGYVFRVGLFNHFVANMTCCHTPDGERLAVERESAPIGWPISQLKRIPPLEELEGQRTEEKLKEPA